MPVPNVVFRIRPTSTWKTDFRRAEMDFFGIGHSDWRSERRKKLKDLHPNYNQAHPFHVAWLNQRLSLATPLRESHFDGNTTVIALRDTVVANRIQVQQANVQLDADEATLNSVGLGHLLSLSTRVADDE